MSKGNPIIPSEPLSLQADLIAEAVLADEADSRDNGGWDRELSPRSASKVRRRTDNRNYGRSESPRRSESYGRDDDHDTYMEHRESPQSHRHRGGRGDRSVSGHNRNGGSWNNDGAEGRSRSPGYVAPRSPDYAAPRSPSSGGRNDYRRRANDRDREPEAASNDPYMR
ncbi:hypothetical protein IWQ57_000819 [Coemansia nantahalensis]|nr:hypothetical protein IWQ57_000819 [Coemansia nantahalensis]